MNTSHAKVFASVLFIGVSLLPNNLYGQRDRPVAKPQVPVIPPQQVYPQQVYPQQVYPQQVYPQPQYQVPPPPPPPPLFGTNCYAGQVIGSLSQAAPVGTSCYVVAYGATYPGTVGQ